MSKEKEISNDVNHIRQLFFGFYEIFQGFFLMLAYFITSPNEDASWFGMSIILIVMGAFEFGFEKIIFIRTITKAVAYNNKLAFAKWLIVDVMVIIFIFRYNRAVSILFLILSIIEVAIYIAIPYRWEIKRWIKKKRKAARNKNKKP